MMMLIAFSASFDVFCKIPIVARAVIIIGRTHLGCQLSDHPLVSLAYCHAPT